MTTLYIFTKDLRFGDNPGLTAAINYAKKARTRLECVIAIDPRQANPGPYHSERAFEAFLKYANELVSTGRVKIYRGTVAEVATQRGATRVFITFDVSPFARQRVTELSRVCDVTEVDGHYVGGWPKGVYKRYSSFVKNITKRPKKFVLLPAPWSETKLKSRKDALKKLASYKGEASGLSVEIARGVLSPREVWNATDERCHRELLFRDFYAYLTMHFPEPLSSQQRFRNGDYRWQITDDAAAIRNIRQSVIAPLYNKLVATGDLTNRERMIFATFVWDIGADWRIGERLFARHLRDYDINSNHHNWTHHSTQGNNFQWPLRKINVEAAMRR